MKQSFKSICKKDIVEILSIIDEHLPKLEKWYFDQSIIYEKNKRIICRSIKDYENNKIGNEIRVHINDTKNVFYCLRYKDNSIYLLEKDGYNTKMIYVTLNDIIIKRQIEINNEIGKSIYKKEYCVLNENDLLEYETSESLNDVLNNLNKKDKVRKRK